MTARAALLCYLFYIVQSKGHISTQVRKRPERRLLALRGGNAVISIVKGQAEQAIREQERRDDVRSLICVSRATFGLFSCFSP